VKAAVYDEPGGPDVFRYEDVPDPKPSADGVLVRSRRSASKVATHCIAHTARSRTLRTSLATKPQGPCSSREGARVVTVGTDGSHAELRAVPERFCWAIPDGPSTDEAACVPVAFGTADAARFEFGRLQPGNRRDPARKAAGRSCSGDRLAR
jgi:NADPH2:quinone reductase